MNIAVIAHDGPWEHTPFTLPTLLTLLKQLTLHALTLFMNTLSYFDCIRSWKYCTWWAWDLNGVRVGQMEGMVRNINDQWLMIINDISRSYLVRYFCDTIIPAMSMISHEVSWWDIFCDTSDTSDTSNTAIIQVIQVRLTHLWWPDFRVTSCQM